MNKLAAIVFVVAGCSSGPQLPVGTSVPTITVRNSIVCDGGEHQMPTEVPEGPQMGGTCSASTWVDLPASVNQTTTGIETGDADVDTDIPVDVQ